MATVSETLGVAVRHLRAGQLHTAQQICQSILEVEPTQADALSLVGLIAFQTGHHQAAIELLKNAIRTNGADAALHFNLGNAYRALGMNAEAIASYQQALLIKPDFVVAHNNLGFLLRRQGRIADAVVCFQRALQSDPNFVEALWGLGESFREQGHISESAACFQSVLRLNPDNASAHNSLGIALMEQGRHREAAVCFQQAVRLKPDYANAHNNWGAAFYEQGRLAEAVDCYQRALQFNSDHAEAHNNLGNALEEQGQFVEAVNCYQQALRLQPDDSSALIQLVHQLQQLCLWDDLPFLSQRIIRSVERETETGDVSQVPVSPVSFLALPAPTTAKQQLQCARHWVEHQIRPMFLTNQNRTPEGFPRSKSRITIGYLSADFRSHPVSHQIVELFERHDRARFSVVGYSYGRDDGSLIRQRVVDALDRFVDLTDTSFEDAASQIRADHVDILVDLTGYTQHARTQILALRPAPIQVSYLGYLATMGTSFMDYILVDDFVVPTEQQPFFTERLVHLPSCFQVNGQQREITPQKPTRAECGLPEKGFVFCCFNNNYKITPEMFDVWMRLLKSIPGSILWLTESNRFAPDNLRHEAEQRGGDADRLVFAPHRPMAEYRAQYRLADLFLDTFPYNAGATASDALWAGCLLLTLSGETFVSRMAGSLLRALGLPELMTTSFDEYQSVALRLATDDEFRESLRSRLNVNRSTSPLFDPEQFARHLEAAFATMYEIHAAGKSPQAFAVRPT